MKRDTVPTSVDGCSRPTACCAIIWKCPPSLLRCRLITAPLHAFCSNTPVDVIKTRMQGLSADKYKSVWDCALQIAKHEVRLKRASAC